MWVFLGEDCSVDVDGCHNNPCEPPYACTDNTPAEHRSTSVAYRCDNCTAGYRFGKEKKCVGKYSSPPPSFISRLALYLSMLYLCTEGPGTSS